MVPPNYNTDKMIRDILLYTFLNFKMFIDIYKCETVMFESNFKMCQRLKQMLVCFNLFPLIKNNNYVYNT